MNRGPELVVGLVGAIGTDLAGVSETLQQQLLGVGYSASEIHVSQLLHDIDSYASLASITDRESYYDKHMTAGDDICEQLKRPDAMALLAIFDLKRRRSDRNLEAGVEAAKPLQRHVFIISSLKRKDEVKTLRRVYGDGFILLGAYAARDRRLETLAARIARSKNKEAHECRDVAERLMLRDESERVDFGQDISNTYFRADAFIDATERSKLAEGVRRFVEVLFGHPFATPSREELGMQHAFTAGLRSADLSRQVGCAITTNDGQVLAVGTNDVPKAGGGIYWPGEYDYRDFRYAETDEPNAEKKRGILKDILTRLAEEGLLAAGVAIDDAGVIEIAKRPTIKESRLMSITEYGRAVHAEMAAITDAARRGVTIAESRLFSTTFPCHNCAKHIVAAGIREVIYIEPYPKSHVASLFSDSIAIDRKPNQNQVGFSSFVGFAPTLFTELFKLLKRTDDEKHILSWETVRGSAVPRVSGIPAAYLVEELTSIEDLTTKLAEKGLSYRKGANA